MKIALIALGGNATSSHGNPQKTLQFAINRLGVEVGRITQRSAFFATPCFPAGAGPDFVNAAVAVATEKNAAEVLATLHSIEGQAQRERTKRWGQRTLDLDLLALDDQILPDLATYEAWRNLPLEAQMQHAPDALVLPHPRIQDRAFVLVPLAEIAPDWMHPVLGRSVVAMRDACSADDLAAVTPLQC
ncbi:2-amino-4-hydroxy-6-hydroxymethyldihydropteridine diphosphokinase [Nereida sp. MMG025]|uniref:2-amino-4-hydroxy-6- hydroxymethyldihydropteridine diphosphokinase n=1 Tax=Nereida sp. MMG025 TaxID=2909981 RepID=UPI001EFFEB7D|nr:2-amino-4-hydroxy-6-hydroxymethyldihydropteridine diphosphokinase [Nereida sp. MMG025]MCF6445969.1 2-amino-4-hydroxy-6-hydroxymethyldihydropteridine diphosphokinase [Nereida sp. MMG025]